MYTTPGIHPRDLPAQSHNADLSLTNHHQQTTSTRYALEYQSRYLFGDNNATMALFIPYQRDTIKPLITICVRVSTPTARDATRLTSTGTLGGASLTSSACSRPRKPGSIVTPPLKYIDLSDHKYIDLSDHKH